MNRASIALRTWRLCWVVTLIALGALTSLCLLPWCSDRRRLTIKAAWSRWLVRAMGVRIDADLTHVTPGAMIVANHISWVDVFVINAVLPSAFVAKSEVRRWPLLGWLAEKNDTIFMQRGRRCDAHLTNDRIARMLARGKHVAIFPEGTTTDGLGVRHFHAALLQPALQAGRPVIPAAISYWEHDAQRSLAPRYDGDITFGQCLWATLSQRRLIARLTTTPALGMNGEDRRQVAELARMAIAGAARMVIDEDARASRGAGKAEATLDRISQTGGVQKRKWHSCHDWPDTPTEVWRESGFPSTQQQIQARRG